MQIQTLLGHLQSIQRERYFCKRYPLFNHLLSAYFSLSWFNSHAININDIPVEIKPIGTPNRIKIAILISTSPTKNNIAVRFKYNVVKTFVIFSKSTQSLL